MPAFPATPTSFIPGAGGGSTEAEATPEPESTATQATEPEVEATQEAEEPEPEPGFTLCSSSMIPAIMMVGLVYHQIKSRRERL
jgi:hypothetical protein